MCTVLLPPGVNPIAVNKYITCNIKHTTLHTSYIILTINYINQICTSNDYKSYKAYNTATCFSVKSPSCTTNHPFQYTCPVHKTSTRTTCTRSSWIQGRIKLFGAPRQWKHFRPLFQAVKHHASQSQDRNNKYFILYLNFASIITFKM